MVTIAAPRAWALGTLRQRSWMSHVLTAGTWPWRCCAPDTSSLDVGVSPLLCPVLVSPAGPGWFEDHSESFPVEYVSAGLSLLEHIAPSGVPGWVCGVLGQGGAKISFGAPADDGISITASGDELGSGEDDLAALPPSGRVALPESDPELTAMLSRAAESIGLHYRRPPSPERSRLGDWFLGSQAERRQPPPVPFFPEVHEEVTRSWKAPFSARNRPSASSVLTTLDGGAAQGYVEVPGVLQELRTATDLALRATKVMARALGQTISTLVVQERHLWLTLEDMRESDKHRFLDSPISQAGLFGEAVEDFAQQFSAAQKQTEAFRHILPRRSAAVSTPPPAAAPPSARRRGRPPADAFSRIPCPTMEPGQCHTTHSDFETHCLSSRAPVLHFAAPPWVRQ